MADAKRVKLAREVIGTFGGITKAARALCVPVPTVQGWGKRGIPHWRIPAIKQAASLLRIEIPEIGAAQ